jgi:predicted DNA-binding protein YlxM (UPF0122 family)
MILVKFKQIAEENNVSYETVRKAIKDKVKWRKTYLSDFTEEQKKKISESIKRHWEKRKGLVA